ncbi:MAG: hypothetical protein IPI67_31570 [Myxococcales bacterium]|nr:hypothetical protein [Myxococcales bacterium]
MATLAIHTTLDLLTATVADLEARVVDLKKVANTLAEASALDPPYRDVASATPRPRVLDMSGGPVADSQD